MVSVMEEHALSDQEWEEVLKKRYKDANTLSYKKGVFDVVDFLYNNKFHVAALKVRKEFLSS